MVELVSGDEKRKMQKFERERDEAREELAAMREGIDVLQKVAELSERHACGEEYRLGKRAKAILIKLQPFIK